MQDIWKRHWLLLTALLCTVLIVVLHLIGLSRFPVFADEAIYIRWAQLIDEDTRRYLFFPLNDGKTPLFMWLVALLQPLVFDQLAAGRLVSVAAAVIQMWSTFLLVRAVGGKARTQLFALICAGALPFWFFHHHLALTDGLLTAWLSVTVLAIVRWQKDTHPKWLAVAAVSWGAALLTKLPAVVAGPGLALLLLLPRDWSLKTRFIKAAQLGASLALGSLLFIGLKISPAFGQLFWRGNQFLFGLDEVLGGMWMQTIQNVPTYMLYFWQYLTPPIFVLLIAGLFSKYKAREIHIFFWAGVLFVAPIAIMGRVVFARYLLPAMLFFTPAAMLSLEALYNRAQRSKHELKRIAYLSLVGLAAANAISISLYFALMVVCMPNKTPFVSSDAEQYLREWSSGHGIYEVTQLLQKEAQTKRIAVATEGFFGTLPDGMLLYLYNRDVSNIYVEGIGVPVKGLPNDFVSRAASAQETWLVVNSHRLAFSIPPEQLIVQFCRPGEGTPCLQVWNVTPQVRAAHE